MQRSSQKTREEQEKEDQKTIEEFDLFITEPKTTADHTLDFDDMLAIHNETQKIKPRDIAQSIDFDTLLNINSKDILPNNIEINLEEKETSPTFWDEPEEIILSNKGVPKDTFFDKEAKGKVAKASNSENNSSTDELEVAEEETPSQEIIVKKSIQEEKEGEEEIAESLNMEEHYKVSTEPERPKDTIPKKTYTRRGTKYSSSKSNSL